MHRNAKLTPAGRRILVERIQSGRPAAHVAAEMGVARKTAYKWWQRWLAEGEAGLQDRSSRPQRSPARVPARLERRIERLRRRRKLGPARIAWRLRMAPSTVYRVLCRLGLNRLSWLDRPTGRVIRRRYEHPRPGDLLHMDVKKLGRIPPRRRLARPRPRSRPPSRPQPRWLRLHPFRGRRPLPPRLQRGPRRRARGHHGRLLAAGLRLVRRARRHRARRAHRQRPRLSQLRVRARVPRRRRAPSPHTALPPPDQRQGRALPPYLPRGVGLCPRLPQRGGSYRRPCALAAPLITAVTPPSAATLRSAVSPTSRKITASAELEGYAPPASAFATPSGSRSPKTGPRFIARMIPSASMKNVAGRPRRP